MLREGFLKLYANEQLYDLEGPFPPSLKAPAIVIHHAKILEKNTPSILASLSLAFSKSPSVCLHIEHLGKTFSKTYKLGLQDSEGNLFPKGKQLPSGDQTYLCPCCHGRGSLTTFSILPYKQRFAQHTPLSLFTSLFPNQDPSPIYSLLEDLEIPSTTLFLEMDDDAFQNLCLGTQFHPGFNTLCYQRLCSRSLRQICHPTSSPKTPCDQCKGPRHVCL